MISMTVRFVRPLHVECIYDKTIILPMRYTAALDVDFRSDHIFGRYMEIL